MGTTRPGAMSLLDKYAQINANIEEARRRVASTRSALESANQSIENLRDEREGMLHETAVAKSELARLEERLKGEKVQKKEKLNEKERAEREHRLVKKECIDTRRQMDRERLAFLERCREFRSSCKRMRVAATLLVLDGGGAFDMEGSLSENDVWRRLQEEDLDSSDDECDGKAKPVRKGKKKKPDIEMEQVIKDEKESREAFIEAECALHAARSEHEEAVKRCNARNNKLIQQRAQLEKHRREVEELEREIGQVNDQIVKANQHAKNYENAWKRGQTPSNSSYNRNTSNNGAYASNFNPPPEYTPLHNSSNQTYRGNSNGPVSNPYKTKPSNPYQNRTPGNQGVQDGRSSTTSLHQYASEMLRNNTTSRQNTSTSTDYSYGSSWQPQNRSWSNNRNQRQFGTAVGVSVDYSASKMTDGTPKYGSSYTPATNRTSLDTPLSSGGGDDSSVSSSSSGDDIISFDIFGKNGNK